MTTFELGTEARSPADSPEHILVDSRIDALAPAYVRTMGGGTYWYEIEKSQGSNVWDDADAQIAANLGKSKIIYQCFLAPDWANALPPDKFITAFAAHIKAVAARYNGRIWGIDVWNEPGIGSFKCLPPTATESDVMVFYDKLVRAAYIAIRTVNTNVKILGPNFADLASDAMLSQLRQLGTLNSFDILTFHDYAGKTWLDETDRARMLDATDTFGCAGYSLNALHYSRPVADQLAWIKTQSYKPIAIEEFGAYVPEQIANYFSTYREAGVLYVIPHAICVGPTTARPDDPLYGHNQDGSERDNLKAIKQAQRLATTP